MMYYSGVYHNNSMPCHAMFYSLHIIKICKTPTSSDNKLSFCAQTPVPVIRFGKTSFFKFFLTKTPSVYRTLKWSLPIIFICIIGKTVILVLIRTCCPSQGFLGETFMEEPVNGCVLSSAQVWLKGKFYVPITGISIISNIMLYWFKWFILKT